MNEYAAFSVTNVNPATVQAALQNIFDQIKNRAVILSSDFIINPLTGQLSVNLILKVSPN